MGEYEDFLMNHIFESRDCCSLLQMFVNYFSHSMKCRYNETGICHICPPRAREFQED
jgi:hypothetical protein